MSTSEKLQILFEAALMESEPQAPSRMAALPRNPNGSQSLSNEASRSSTDQAEQFDPRREMLARVSRMKEMLNNS